MRRSSFRQSVLLVVLVAFGCASLMARPAGPQVFTGSDVGRYFLHIWVPDYPYAARRNKVSGRGTYRAYVEPSGKVIRVVVIKSTGSVDLDDAVVRAALNWKARAGKKMEVDFPMAFVATPNSLRQINN